MTDWSNNVEIDLDKIQTIEEVKAALKLVLVAATGWDGIDKIEVSTSVMNKFPVLNNLVKDNHGND